jgi:hypothetical protein
MNDTIPGDVHIKRGAAMHYAGICDVVFIAMFVLCFVIRAPVEVRNKKIKAVESREGAVGKFCLLLVFTGSTTLPFL